MQTNYHAGHLTYCSNIHPGETWEETFNNLKNHTRLIAKGLTQGAFGIGLRISNAASLDLIKPELLQEFKGWLAENDMYVFTINGFPYGGFHHQIVKDKVHQPDWTTEDRLAYTKRLFDILKELLPDGMDGGVSTSPISYRFWHQDGDALHSIKEQATTHFADLLCHLDHIKFETGKTLHLDLEPEPDGVLETSQEFIDFFNDYLLSQGSNLITKAINCTASQAGRYYSHPFPTVL